MSCNGCRVLRKGCSDACALRQCLKTIQCPEAQGHATNFVAKFFGRAGMMSLINTVPESQRAEIFQSLLYEACGRTINPVFGAVGLLHTGNWHLCEQAVESVLRGGFLPRDKIQDSCQSQPRIGASRARRSRVLIQQQPNSPISRKRCFNDEEEEEQEISLDLKLGLVEGDEKQRNSKKKKQQQQRAVAIPCLSSEVDSDTTDLSVCDGSRRGGDKAAMSLRGLGF